MRGIPRFRLGMPDCPPTVEVRIEPEWFLALRNQRVRPDHAADRGAIVITGDPVPLIAMAETVLRSSHAADGT